MNRMIAVWISFLLASPAVLAQTPPKVAGPVIAEYGAVFDIPSPDFPTDPGLTYQVVFDIAASPDEPDALNPAFNTVARFLNMHARAGVPLKQLKAVVVVHGRASKDVLLPEKYEELYGTENPNFALIQQLSEAGVELYFCGQSMYGRGLQRPWLSPDIQLALSAMTVLTTYQEKGYHLIRF
ncbi:MAG: DsrE family protein [Bacteroidota bacterium]